ncbi:methionyl-tRNA formyltransferase [Paenibacillus koleovorans]|uniref:methionyl-tRNA formyltransferase n=1 Tax=Paenibacillus koleovorans TaxID=121608 RepID=UPI000FD780E7|nr:formyltransferase family protein [Paenibacillus koleovorans]
MKIAALGRTNMLYESILKVHEAGHEVVLIGTCKEAPEYDKTAEDFKELAERLGAVFFYDTQINSPRIVELMSNSRAEIAISVNWLTIIGKDAISAFPFGILNAHGGDLPRYRGNACANWALIEYEKRVTMTIHQMEAGELDSGPIVTQEHLPINEQTTIGNIYTFFENIVPELFVKSINGLSNGAIAPKPQPKEPQLALRCYPRIPSDSLLDWQSDAKRLVRIINASSEPFNGAYTYLNSQKLIVWEATFSEFEYPSLYVPGQVVRIQKDGTVDVASGDGVVVLKTVQLESAPKQPAASVIKSMRTRLGMHVEEEIYFLHSKIRELEAFIQQMKK